MQFDEIRMKNASIQAAIQIDQDEGRNAVDPIDFYLHRAIKKVCGKITTAKPIRFYMRSF